jgi:hypothetical protein
VTPDKALASHRKMIAQTGEDVIVRRYRGPAGPNQVHDDVTVRARVMGYQPRDLVGSVVQGDRRVIMMVDALAAILPLRTSDKCVIRGVEVAIKGIDDNTRRIAGTLIALELQVAG